jgi:DNA-binding ferritin-like protein
MNAILADVFALYLKTKNFHWHMSGPHFRDYHLLLDEHGDQLFAMTDPIAERIRKIGGPTLKSIGHISRVQRILDNDADYVEPSDMLAELAEDNKTLAARLRQAHNVCDEHRDMATASLIESLDRRDRASHLVSIGNEAPFTAMSNTSAGANWSVRSDDQTLRLERALFLTPRVNDCVSGGCMEPNGHGLSARDPNAKFGGCGGFTGAQSVSLVR